MKCQAQHTLWQPESPAVLHLCWVSSCDVVLCSHHSLLTFMFCVTTTQQDMPCCHML